MGIMLTIRITLPAPYDRVRASVEDASVSPYESEGGQSLDEWLAELGRTVAVYDE